MKLEKYLMTPQRAAQILDRTRADDTFANRPMRASLVKSLARAIREGQWVFTHQAIALDSAGVCIDGQHRLAATVEAGIAVPVMLATGCERESFKAIDCGVKRTYSDRIHISNNHVFNTRAVSIARAYVAYGKGIAASLINTNDVELAYLEIQGGIDAVANKFTHKVRGITRYDSGAALAVYYAVHPNNGQEFLDLWYSGSRLPRESPILILREAFLGGRVSNGPDAYWKMVRATRAHFRGENLARVSPAASDWMGNERGTSALQAEKKNAPNDKQQKKNKKKDADQ